MRSVSTIFTVLAMLSGLGLTPSALGQSSAVYVARYEAAASGARQMVAQITEVESSEETLTESLVLEQSFPKYVVEHELVGEDRIVELRSRDRAALMAELHARDVAPMPASPEALDEVVTLVESGPSSNRIDLVFMGDGYTVAERAKFFDDIQRIVRDMFEGPTYKSYLPVFNVHAVFRASNESGIGKNDLPKDTAYKLYREGDTLRAIFPGDEDAARASCAAAPGCDYPVIIANDPNYGGLGGEFAISTSSLTSGTVVLRHELGHNFGRVGEEYDGGGYFGANTSTSVQSLKWRHWATLADTRAEPVVARFLAWPWHNLTNGAYEAPFTSDGRFAKAQLRFSASGIRTDDTLSVTLDDQRVPFRAPGYDDRAFHTITYASGFAEGAHVLRFEEHVPDGDNWVSNLTLHEFGADYHFDGDHIGAYPVFDRNSRVAGYRSNHETCLMRNMQSTVFCSVCQENNWLEFFGKVRLIDDVQIHRGSSETQVTLVTQKLGQLRSPADPTSELRVVWKRNGVEVPTLAGQMTWTLPARDAAGRWDVEVRYVSSEIRKDPRNLTRDTKSLTL